MKNFREMNNSKKIGGTTDAGHLRTPTFFKTILRRRVD